MSMQADLEWQEEEKNLNVRKIVTKAIALWPWMLLCAILAVVLALTYLYFSAPVYKVNAKILIKDEDKKIGGSGGDLSMLQGLGLFSGSSNVDNELEILKSYTLMHKVVSDLQLNVAYFTRSGLKEVQLYGESLPFVASFESFREDSLLNDPKEYTIAIMKSGVEIEGEGRKWKAAWGQAITLPAAGTAIFSAAPEKLTEAAGESYILHVNNTSVTTRGYMKALSAEIPNKQVSTISLALETSVPRKGEVSLNKLIEAYMRANVEDNNRIADSTMTFIDARLKTVGQELTGIEKDIEVFKQRNELANLEEQSKALIENTSQYTKDLAQQEIQLSVIESLQAYLEDNRNNPRIVPASLMVQDPTLTAVISKYNALLMQRERMLLSSTEENPIVKNIDGQLDGLRKDLVSAMASVKRSTQVAVNELRRRTGGIESQIRQVPAKEREFLEYSRQQAIKQELYLFLLQKREEAAISKSSTIANAKIVDAARADIKPVKPKKMMILAMAGLLGILLPFGFVYMRDLFNIRIAGRADIDAGTQVPVIGEIGHNGGEDRAIIVSKTSRSPIVEQFRMMRTNLQFMLPGENDKVIMLTSSMPGEGKTFISLNLAAILALSGKKVVLMEMDLRKPKVSPVFGLEGRAGFSNYAIGQATIDDIIVPAKEYEGLSVIPSGPIPPNPAELLLLDRTKELFAELRRRFDYIVIDTTPNLVTDAQLIGQYADATLYLVRVGVTLKDQLRLPEALSQGGKMPKMSLVVNDVNYKKHGGYYGYGGYGYGYGYGYYAAEEPAEAKRKWQFWKK